ncbi:MAG TPA: Fic family protein [Flavobacteriales bacterium]|nr:Fic family protein [Flavobacteriales bacterium]
MRSYEQTHPWISFRFDPRQLPWPVWIRLGEAAAICRQLRTAALPAKDGELIGYIVLLHGVVANAALDGNTLSEDQVDRLLEGSLQLPPSQLYMEREVRNLVKAVAWTEARAKAADHDTGPWTLQVLNAQVMKELADEQGGAPGQYRTVRDPNPSGGVAPEDIPTLIERLQTWLQGPPFTPEHEEEKLPMAIISAAIIHLYLRWIAPFAAGNGRTARLVEFQLLLNAGIPAPAAHQMAAHAAATRTEYERQVAHAARPGGDPVPFVAYMVNGFADALRSLADEVNEAQYQHLAQEELRRLTLPDGSPAGERLMALATGIHAQPGKIATSRIPRLSAELALAYSRLNAKTLQRDLAQLEHLGLVERSRGAVRAKAPGVRPFRTA